MHKIFSSLDVDPSFKLINEASFASCFSVSKLASSAVAAVGSSMAKLVEKLGLSHTLPEVEVDETLASLWFSQSIYPINWNMPPVWDSLAGDYRTKDGWIKLHTNLTAHREAAVAVLGCLPEKEKVTSEISNWRGDELELEIVSSGGVAAALRSRSEWENHAQGKAVASEPLILWDDHTTGKIRDWNPTRERPLEGLRILDLTRVLAGPVSTRTLAAFGAQVLRIDPPGWNEANVVPDITLGKSCANLDLRSELDRLTFEKLLEKADVLVHGYRPNALERLGYGECVRHQISPSLIEISLDAYGWSGPWAERRGFDSLVQMSCGIAHAGMNWAKQDQPIPLPVQALDHATGYLMAAAAIRAITKSITNNRIPNARLSLARTAEQLISHTQRTKGILSKEPLSIHFATEEEITPWGRANRLRPPMNIEGTPMMWNLAACELGSRQAVWT